MKNELPPSLNANSTTMDSNEVETTPLCKERPSMKRKSDEDLQNDEQKRMRGPDDNFSTEEERRVIILKGSLPQLALPDGWIALNHRSGGIVYLHKPSRVCTWSRPYHIGGGSIRRHDVPLAAIPCLHQKRGLARKHAEEEHSNAAKSSDSNTVRSSKGASILNALNMNKSNSNQETPNHGITEHLFVNEGHERNGLDVVMSLADTSDGRSKHGVMSQEGEPMMNEDTDTDMLVENESVCVTQHKQDSRDLNCSIKQDYSGKQNSKELEEPVGEQSSSSEHPFLETVNAKDLGSYLSNIWEFQSLTSDQERNAVIFQPQVLDGLELPPSLEYYPYALKSMENGKQSGKDLLLNAGGKTPVAILHEYCQRILKTKPVYQSSECESADTPFVAEVQIDGIKYGSGKGSNKKVAKQIAAESTLGVLLPGVFKKGQDYQISEAELEFFDKVDIVDPRLPDFCSKTTLPNPSQILEECLKRNQGICPTPIQFTTFCGQDKTLSFKITFGKHEATGPCKNKRIGKQLASQQLLKKLHPRLEKWGALIRIYCDRPTGAIKKYKVDDSGYVKEQEVRSGSSQLNNNLLERLKEEMRKLHVESTTEKRKDRHSSAEPVFTVDI